MPLSEFYRLTKGKHKSAQHQQEQHQSASAGPGHGPSSSSVHGGDFVELVWENGQVMMKGHPNRIPKPHHEHNTSSSVHAVHLPHHNSRFRDKGAANEDSEMGMTDFIMNDFDQISEHVDIMPGFSYNMDDSEPVHHNNNQVIEVSGVTAAESSIQRANSTQPSDRILHFKDSHHTSDSQRHLSSLRPNTSHLDRALSFPCFRPKVSFSATQNISSGESAKKLSSTHSSIKTQNQDLGQRVPCSGVKNFPHFAAIVKPGFDAISAKLNPEALVAKRDNGKEKVSVPGELASPLQVQVMMSKSLEKSHQVGYSGNLSCQGSTRKIERQAIVTEKKMAAENVEKNTQPVVASSVCSANSFDKASNDPTYSSKRKYNESEDSEYPSEDVEEESVDIKRPANNRVGSGSKRSRAAEVHNLSERRRRDRINEKMRALQELIPNCNKVDKASMLDEAIEYLKTLQLQVQMMSMGAGLCMPRMMLPHAAAHMPLGIGMGYGLSMVDMHMNSSNCPSMQIQHIPMEPVSQFGFSNANPMPNLPMFGFQGQGVVMPMLRTPIRATEDLNTASSAQISHSKNTVHNTATEMRIASQAENDEVDGAAPVLKDEHPL